MKQNKNSKATSASKPQEAEPLKTGAEITEDANPEAPATLEPGFEELNASVLEDSASEELNKEILEKTESELGSLPGAIQPEVLQPITKTAADTTAKTTAGGLKISEAYVKRMRRLKLL